MDNIESKLVETFKESLTKHVESNGFIMASGAQVVVNKVEEYYSCSIKDNSTINSKYFKGDDISVSFTGTIVLLIGDNFGNSRKKNYGFKALNAIVYYKTDTDDFSIKDLGLLQWEDSR